MELVAARAETIVKDDVNLGYTDQELYGAVFAPFNWKELPLETLPTDRLQSGCTAKRQQDRRTQQVHS